MATLHELSVTIINELARLQNEPGIAWDESDPFPFPRMIGLGDGRYIFVSKKIDDAICKIADKLLSEDPLLSSRFTLAEWRRTVRTAFGQPLSMMELDNPVDQNAAYVLDAVRSNLANNVRQFGAREHAFGCTLFGDSSARRFSIGPVRFEPRTDWLARKCSEGVISEITRRRIARAWAGNKLRKRKPSAESVIENDIIDAVETSPFICSVVTFGLAPDASQERALTTARLAIAAMALLWRTPSSALAGMNLQYDRHLYRRKVLAFGPRTRLSTRSEISHLPHGPALKDGEWETLLAENASFFDVIAEVLGFVVDPSSKQSRQDILNTLAQALLWFHEGCRESVTLMAIVKFTASLDALACGGKSSGIKKLISARLGLRGNAPIRPDGPTMNAAIDQIYSEGRSRTIHGTNNRLGHDWSGTKGLAEQFARLCLVACIEWAAAHPTSNDPKQLSA